MVGGQRRGPALKVLGRSLLRQVTMADLPVIAEAFSDSMQEQQNRNTSDCFIRIYIVRQPENKLYGDVHLD
jgi:hypothetical protein